MSTPVVNAAYEHNGQHITREGFYAIACDPARSVAVEACAGAGKTWMLVSRIVRALLDGCAANDILAITFTKKAAGEMRARLHEWLDEFAQLPDAQLEGELRARGLADTVPSAMAMISADRIKSVRTAPATIVFSCSAASSSSASSSNVSSLCAKKCS